MKDSCFIRYSLAEDLSSSWWYNCLLGVVLCSVLVNLSIRLHDEMLKNKVNDEEGKSKIPICEGEIVSASERFDADVVDRRNEEMFRQNHLMTKGRSRPRSKSRGRSRSKRRVD